MGLFGSPKKENKKTENTEEVNGFNPVVVDTENIVEEIKNISTARKINPKKLSVKLLNTTTLYKVNANDNYKEATKEDLKLFDDDEFFLNPDLKVRQHFKIKIYVKSEKNEEVIPDIILGGNKSLTKIIATVKHNPAFRYFDGLEELIIEDINIKKIRVNILVGIRDTGMYKEIKKLIALIQVKNFDKEDFVLTVCQGLDKVPSIDDKLLFHYKEKTQAKDNSDRVDYAKRGFVLAVSKNETIIEYVKPAFGTVGRNCQGRLLSVSEPLSNYDGNFTHTENIIKKEDDNKIIYIANISGYINIENGTYDVKENIEIESINFRSTGSIETDINSNVTINIKENDVLKDAIGPGMSVETTELNIEGNIGSGAVLKTKKITIKGQTHKTSKIETEFADIAIHRGEICGENIEIDTLEGGIVYGDIVHVKNPIGGEIVAREIYVDELTSNTILRASSLIDIKKVRGSNNKISIDPASIKAHNEKITKINQEIKDIRTSLKPQTKLLEGKNRLIYNNRKVIKSIKDKIIGMKQSGETPPISLVNKIKEYKKMVNDYNTLLSNFKSKKHKLVTLNEELSSVQNQIFSSKIICRGPWKEFNELKFKLILPSIELIYNTKSNETIRVATLVKIGEDEFEIKKSSEYEE